MRASSSGRSPRRAVAAVELAFLAPLLVFLFAVGVDFARVYYFAIVLEDSARSGALYGSATPSQSTDTNGIKAAALANATDLNPVANVNSSITTDANGNQFVQVTTTWTFRTITGLPGLPASIDLTRSCTMMVAPLLPKNS